MRKCERAKTATSYANCAAAQAKKAAKAKFKSCVMRARSVKGRSRKAKAEKKHVLEQCLRGGGTGTPSTYSKFAKQYAPQPRPRSEPWLTVHRDRERLVHPFEGY